MRRAGLWRDSDFLKLWAGQAISQLGSRITREGLPLTAVLVLGASPFQMGLLSGAGAAAILVFGIFAGAWADRVKRRPVLLFADLGRAAVLLTIPLAAAMHRLTMAQLYAVAAITGILTVFFDVSYQAYLPSLAGPENTLEGNSKLALTESIAEVAGPGMTGFLVQWITAPAAIFFDAVSFILSALSISLIRKPESAPERAGHSQILREIGEGLRVAWREPVLRAIALRTATGFFFLGFISSLYMLFALRVLRLNAAQLGVVISLGGASSLFGAFAAPWLVRRFGVGPNLIGAALISGVGAILPPFAHGSVTACSIILGLSQLLDMAWPVYAINELTLRQAIVPGAMLGRVNAAMHLLSRGVLPVGGLVGGMLAGTLGIRMTMFAGAFGFLLSTLWLVFSRLPHLRDLPAAGPIA